MPLPRLLTKPHQDRAKLVENRRYTNGNLVHGLLENQKRPQITASKRDKSHFQGIFVKSCQVGLSFATAKANLSFYTRR
jgi:hypothetical protein